jgi:tetratricopeptide (TPR) repeat protein
MVPVKYRAFISYSHQDAKWATWLHKSIEVYRPPRHIVGRLTERGPVPKRLAPVFRDREELPSATDLGERISAALQQSACLLVICSPKSARSRWVNEEILAYKRLGGESRIFCIVVGGEPNASDRPEQAADECFPPALRFKIAADGQLSTERTEPIAADARPGKDGRVNAKLKLIAGMLGVGFNELRQREQQRRNRRLAIIATASLLGMVLTTGLAAVALIARANAERQRLRAEAQAETSRQTTSFLVDLFRISDPGEARGNTVTAREMLDRGAERVKVELARQPAIQATLMDTLGTVYTSLGLYAQARPLLEAALVRRREAQGDDAAAAPDSLVHLADVLSLQAEYQAAEKDYRAATALVRSRAGDGKAPNVQAQATVAKSLAGLGFTLFRLGRLPEAEAALREALDLQRQLVPGPHSDTARTLQDLALVISRRGNVQAAIPVMEDALTMQRQLRGDQPHPALAEALNNLGLLLYTSGEYERSAALILQSITMKRVLLGNKHPEIAISLNNLAMLMQDKGNLSAADSLFRQALAMHRELEGNLHPDVANTLNNLAFVLHDEGKITEAMNTKRESLQIYQQLFPGDHPETAATLNTLGFWQSEQGRYAEAEQSLRQGLEMRRRLLGNDHPNVASSLSNLAILQVATHRYQEAVDSARDAARIFSLTLPPTHWKLALARATEGAALLGLKRYAEAQRLIDPSYATLAQNKGVLPSYRKLVSGYREQLYGAWHPPQSAARDAAAVKLR